MIPIDPSWIRYINASISKHFKTLLTPTLFLYIEGQPRETIGQQNYVELRFHGPHCNRLSPTTFKLYVTINCLIVSIKDSQTNVYNHDDHIGLVLSAFTNAITIFKYGGDQTELGCMKLAPDVTKDIIEISRYGQTVPSMQLQEATIEASYEMLIS